MLLHIHHRKVYHDGLFKALSVDLVSKSNSLDERKHIMYAEFLTLLVLLLIIEKLSKLNR